MVVVAAVVAAIAIGGFTFMKSMQSSKVSDSGTIETVETAIPESEENFLNRQPGKTEHRSVTADERNSPKEWT